MSKIYFENWESIFHVSLSTILAYTALVAMLRVSGKRTLAKMNAFDFVVTVALGSTFATIALSKDVPLADGVAVFLLLIVMQFLITWLSVRAPFVKKLVASQPVLLLYKGEALKEVMKRERIMMDDLYTALRQKGVAELKDVDAVVLETTGDLTVITTLPLTPSTTLADVKNDPLKPGK